MNITDLLQLITSRSCSFFIPSCRRPGHVYSIGCLFRNQPSPPGPHSTLLPPPPPNELPGLERGWAGVQSGWKYEIISLMDLLSSQPLSTAKQNNKFMKMLFQSRKKIMLSLKLVKFQTLNSAAFPIAHSNPA